MTRTSTLRRPSARRDRQTVSAILSSPLADWYLVLAATGLLLGLGALMAVSASSVYSESITGSPWFIAVRQLAFLLGGLVPSWWISRQTEPRLKTLGWVFFIISILLMLAIFVPGLGSDAGKGHLAWLRLGPLTVQPSEFAKLGLIMWSAAVVSTKEKILDRPRELLFPLFVGFALVLLLILSQKDLGTALVVGGFILAMLWVIGLPGRMLAAVVGLGVVMVLLLVVTSSNRMIRVMAYLGGTPANDPNSSQQPLASVYGLASGGWWGVGLGASRQKWGNLYDGAQNDFVFAVLGEELGLLGTLTVLGLIAVVAATGLRIARRSSSIFARVAATGITSWLVIQSMINIGVDMQILPVIGVPLPFISIGGTALVANMLAVGVLLACARMEPEAQAARGSRRQRRSPRPRADSRARPST